MLIKGVKVSHNKAKGQTLALIIEVSKLVDSDALQTLVDSIKANNYKGTNLDRAIPHWCYTKQGHSFWCRVGDSLPKGMKGF